jgi:prevent-host-death family protein
MSTTVGVRDLKNSLSRWLRLVRGGEIVVVLDRGRPVAVLSPAAAGGRARSAAEHLASLARRGLLVLGTARRRPRPKRLPKANLSAAVAEDRGELA